jgi:mercuric ion transport protein
MNQKQALISGVLAGIGASLCCVAPLVLLGLGIGGAWVANLTLFEPVRPVFLLLTLFFLGLAFRELYLTPPACDPDKPCAEDTTLKRRRIVFWLVAVPLLGLVALPWYAALFY